MSSMTAEDSASSCTLEVELLSCSGTIEVTTTNAAASTAAAAGALTVEGSGELSFAAGGAKASGVEGGGGEGAASDG